MEIRIEPSGILNIRGDRLLKKVNNLMFKGKMGDKLVTEIRMLMNIEAFFLRKFCFGAFHLTFSKLLYEAKINTKHVHNKPNTPIEIMAAVAILPEEEELMAAIYADERRIYINVTTMKDKDKDYEEEMRNAVGELKREE